MKSWKEINILNRLLAWSKSCSMPGLSGVPIYNVIKFVYLEATKDDILTRANSVAFNLFISIFPAIIFVFTLLPYIPFAADYFEVLKRTTSELMPVNAHEYLFEVIEGVTSREHGGLRSVGFIFAMLFSSSGMLTLMYGFHKGYESIFKKRSYLRNRLIALMLTLMITILLVMSLILIIFGQPLLGLLQSYVPFDGVAEFIVQLIKWALAVLIIYTGITLMYRYGSDLRKRVSWFNTGAVLATFLSISSSVGFSFFINNFGKYNQIYGSIGALIVLLIWLQINALAILVGFEFNASIAINKQK